MEMTGKPNVLLLMVDALRADRCWGDARTARTPVLDDLIARSTVFTRAFSCASVTTVCFTSLLTGTYPLVNGVHSLLSAHLSTGIPTLPELFQRSDYFTWAEVTGPLEPVRGLDRGFDDYRHRSHTDWLDTEWGDRLLSRFEDSSLREPWFGLLHLWELHNPRRVTPGYDSSAFGATLYDRAVSSLDAQLARLLEAMPENTLVILTGDHGEYVAESRRGDLMSRLKAPLKWVKAHVPGAKRLRRLAPTVVAGLNELTAGGKEVHYGWLGHGYHVYDYLVHVPLILHHPALFPAQAHLPALVSHVDLVPTLGAACGLTLDDATQLSGVDLMPLVRGETANGGHDAVYLEASVGLRDRSMAGPDQWLAGIRTDRYKYARGLYNPEIPEELYDLLTDPDEKLNILHEQPRVAAELRAQFDAIVEPYTVQMPGEGSAYSPEEQRMIEQRLQELGYIE